MNHWTRWRWRVRLLAMIDWLLGTHLLEQTTSHWQEEIAAVQTEISSLQARMDELSAAHRAVLRHMCLTYLQLRQSQSPERWLHFDPRQPAEESAIEVITRALVAPHWARWRLTQLDVESVPSAYTYDLVPDWASLHQDALERAPSLPAGLLQWLQEQAETERS